MAYVPIPEGSSSEAPVTRPGPRTRRKRFTGCDSRIKSALYFARAPVCVYTFELTGAQYNHTVCISSSISGSEDPGVARL